MNHENCSNSSKFSISAIAAVFLFFILWFGGCEKSEVTQEMKTDSVVPWKVPELNTISDIKSKDRILYGKELMNYTDVLVGPRAELEALRYAGNNLTCSNCHFDAGTNPNSYNLVGVTSRYPQYSERLKSLETIEDRINDCFERSLNGKPLPVDSEEMKAYVAYFEFISQYVPKGYHVQYEGLQPIAQPQHTPDIESGKMGYIRFCETCHGGTGEGALSMELNRITPKYLVPPVWGDDSFNTGAGMHDIHTAAQFIFFKMPYGDEGVLTLELAYDIAAYINSQPRPIFYK